MVSTKEIAKSEYQDSAPTSGGKFTARFKNPLTGEEEVAVENKTPEENKPLQQASGVEQQLSPLENIQKAYYESEKNKNIVKIKLYKTILYICLPAIGILASIITGFWIYQLTSLTSPTSTNTSEIGNLKSKDSEFDTKLKTLEDRLYNLINEKNSYSKTTK